MPNKELSYLSIYSSLESYINEMEEVKISYKRCEEQAKNQLSSIMNNRSSFQQEKEEKLEKLKTYMSIAKLYSNECEEADAPEEYNENVLFTLQLQIDSQSKNDESAKMLYKAASAQKMFVEQLANDSEEQEQIRQIKSNFINDRNRLQAQIKKRWAACVRYMKSDAFVKFCGEVKDDYDKFSRTFKRKELPEVGDYMSIGSMRLPFNFGENVEKYVSQLAGNALNTGNKTIGIPLSIDIVNGGKAVFEYRDLNRDDLVAGLQNVIFNAAQYYSQYIKKVVDTELVIGIYFQIIP